MKLLLIAVTFLFLTACLANATAHVYVNSDGDMIYCSNKQPDNLKDFEYVGTASVAESEIRLCELADS